MQNKKLKSGKSSWEERHPWFKYHNTAQQRCRCKKTGSYKYYGAKGIEYKMTLHDVEKLWVRDKAHSMKKASIDRIDSKKHYTFDNCRFLEYGENVRRANLGLMHEGRQVKQLSQDNELIKKWRTIRDASKHCGVLHTAIQNCLAGKTETSGGYKWEYV